MSSMLSVEVSTAKSFDYTNLQPDTAKFVQAQTKKIRALMKRTAQDIIDIGQQLIEVKKCLGYGQYRLWIETEFNWGKSTANSFEHVANRFAHVQNLDNFAPSALYQLAAPSTPDAAREEAIARAQAGETINYKVSKAIKQKHTHKIQQKNQQPNLKISEVDSGKQQDSAHPSILFPKTKVNTQFSQQPSAIKAESWFKLGKHHVLYCGDPLSAQFPTKLPSKISLAISFPDTVDWQLGNLVTKVNSSLILFSRYEDVDFKPLRELVRNALELYTNGDDTVVFSFLPDPALLLLAETLSCRCAIAEPNLDRCSSAIQLWIKTRGKVTQI